MTCDNNTPHLRLMVAVDNAKRGYKLASLDRVRASMLRMLKAKRREMRKRQRSS